MAKHSKTPSSQHLKFAVLASDVALFTLRNDELLVRVVTVHRPPYFSHAQGLPGGLIGPKETAEQAASRLIAQKGKISSDKVYLEQLATFSEVKRDPRGRVVAVAYLALVPWESLSDIEIQRTEEAWWSPVSSTNTLAYDHVDILRSALERLRSRVTYTTIISKLMPAEFTLSELEKSYQAILHTALDKRNFRKKIEKLDMLTPLSKKREGGAHRPAALYRFTSRTVKSMEIL